MIPARFAPILFGFLLSGMMSFLVSGIATFRSIGGAEGFLSIWMGGWISSWVVAFPVVLFVAPLTRKLVSLLVKVP